MTRTKDWKVSKLDEYKDRKDYKHSAMVAFPTLEHQVEDRPGIKPKEAAKPKKKSVVKKLADKIKGKKK